MEYIYYWTVLILIEPIKISGYYISRELIFLIRTMQFLCKRLKFLESMFRKGPRYTRGPKYTRGPEYTRGSRQPHHPTCGTRPQQPSSNGGIHLANSICHLLPHRALTTCSRTATQAAIRTYSDKRYGPIARTASGSTDEVDCKKPSASRWGNQYSYHLDQESKWINPGFFFLKGEFYYWQRNSESLYSSSKLIRHPGLFCTS